MSRACRKLLKQKQPTLAESHDIEEEDLVPEPYMRSSKNTFQMAAELLSSSGEEEEEDNNNSENETETVEEETKIKNKKKNKRKNKSNITATKKEPGQAEDGATRKAAYYNYIEEDEIDRSLREVNQILGELEPFVEENTTSDHITDMKILLNVQNRLLDPQTEITQKKKKPPSKHSKCFNSHLVTPKLEWGYYGRPVGLVMKQVQNKDGVLVFAYEHNATYENIHFDFLDIIHSPFPTEINGFLNQYPFHVDTLLLCALLNRWSGDRDMEVELLARALYCLESAVHPSFSFSRGECVLPYRYQCNRPFHCALLQQASLSLERGAPRAALELCRLGLSLDRGDPLGMALLLDAACLACSNTAWLLSFLRSDYSLALTFLPNMAYSLALAHFLEGHEREAERALQRAVRHFPWILKPLLATAMPGALQTHPYLSYLEAPQALEQLSLLYARRCGTAWREPNVIQWVTQALPYEAIPTPHEDSPASVTQKRFLTTLPLPIKRHLILARDSQANGNTSMEDLLRLSWNPHPPTGGIESYQPRARPPIVPPLPVPSDMSPALAFLYSLAPSFNTNPPNNT